MMTAYTRTLCAAEEANRLQAVVVLAKLKWEQNGEAARQEYLDAKAIWDNAFAEWQYAVDDAALEAESIVNHQALKIA